MILTYWLIKLITLHKCLSAQINQPLMDEIHREWLTESQTVLIPTDPHIAPVTSNYRQITFSSTWKLLSGITVVSMNRHMQSSKKGTIMERQVCAPHLPLADRRHSWCQEILQWLENARLKESTEEIIKTAQEHTLSKRSQVQAVQRFPQDKQVTAGRKIIASREYMKCPNQVTSIVYRDICTGYGLEVQRSNYPCLATQG